MRILRRTLKKTVTGIYPFVFFIGGVTFSIIVFESFYKGYIALFFFMFLLELGQELGLYKLRKVRNRSFWGNSGDIGDSGSDCGGSDSCGGGGGDGGD